MAISDDHLSDEKNDSSIFLEIWQQLEAPTIKEENNYK